MEKTFTNEEKQQIAELILRQFKASGFTSQARFAKSVGLDQADLTNLKGKTFLRNQQLIGPAKWMRIARIAGFTSSDIERWITADTKVKRFIDSQLIACQNLSMTNILCDEAGIGKTHTCREFATTHPNVFYLDCSNSRNKNRFIQALARAVGIEAQGKYDEILADTIYALQLTNKPLIILDEAGDLEDKAILEFKRIYNALEDQCGFYIVGSDGLRAKIERGIRVRKVGYKEVFSRLGKNFSRIMSAQLQELSIEFGEMAEQILIANDVTDKATIADIRARMVESGIKDLRTVKREVRKRRYINQNSRS